jgi:AraC family transcriptional regulator
MTKSGEVQWVRRDGGPRVLLSASRPPGESGVSVFRTRFARDVDFSATTRQHLVFFQLSPHLWLECRMAGRKLEHETKTGALAICPAGIDCSATSNSDADLLLIAVKPGHLALVAAEDSALEAKLNERMSGYDPELLATALFLAAESAKGYRNGPLFWNEIADGFISRLVFGHTSTPDHLIRGSLGQQVLQRIKDYIVAHLAEPIEVAELAGLAGRSPFHFSRVFARSVGMTPYRYVVHLRLQAAIERLRQGHMGLAEIAADTGFSDQSHLSRWVRRVHGVAPSELS